MIKKALQVFVFLLFLATLLPAQESIARKWNEVLLQSIREDFARPPVHARNLFHTSIAMYDAWAAYDQVAQPYLLGKTVGNYTCPFLGIPTPADIDAARREAISFAMLRVLSERFVNSPNGFTTYTRFFNTMEELGYDRTFTSTDYQSGNPAALGNYIGQCVIEMGHLDESNELANYASFYYQPVNQPMLVDVVGNPNVVDPNRWQPLTLTTAIDQNGNPIPATQKFQSPEWGRVWPFALKESEKSVYNRNGRDYYYYNDPGAPPQLNIDSVGGLSEEFKWNMELVSAWSSHLDPDDGVMWDISPKSLGNVQSYPQNVAELRNFYKFEEGGDPGQGHPINPKTGQEYKANVVPRGDYTRVLAQFWADGPNSETPPGHWYAIMNKVNSNPALVKKFNGRGEILSDLEWDIKCYFALGGAVHDAAVTAWGIKGRYDAARPITSLRYMAGLGQSSDSTLMSYHPGGVQLIPGYVELVMPGDPLAGFNNQNVGKIKFYTWRGHEPIVDPSFSHSGAGWVLAEKWTTYQRSTFVTPPFGGYISGHSTYSRAAAECLTLLTGDEFFPGGMEEYTIPAYSGFLGFEAGPSVDVKLQWATYRDASDQTSLSRIWGGIHPPFDDIPGRLLGGKAGIAAFKKASTYFYKDEDGDGSYSFEDCDEHNATVYPDAPELCDGIDNNCNVDVDENLPLFTYYLDVDSDGFGVIDPDSVQSCSTDVPASYSANALDCNDADKFISPAAAEVCDKIDNNCNNEVDDNIPYYDYFVDADTDGFGDANNVLSSCESSAPMGFVTDQTDCNDTDATISPNAAEACDGVDNNCNNLTDDGLQVYTYFVDADGDLYGSAATPVATCDNTAPQGYVNNSTDCDDTDAAISPSGIEVCDGVDNNCNTLADDGLQVYTYFVDADGDLFGSQATTVVICDNTAPVGYVNNGTDCNDANSSINPSGIEVWDGADNDCDGLVDEGTISTTDVLVSTKAYPNPVHDYLYLTNDAGGQFMVSIVNAAGQLQVQTELELSAQPAKIDFTGRVEGVYFLQIRDLRTGTERVMKVVKMN